MHFTQVDKKQLLAALQTHLKARLQAQLQEAEDLLGQASESNKAFFLRFQQRHGQDIVQQLQALEAYAPKLQLHYRLVEPGALVQVSTKHLPVRVPTASTPQNTYQSLSKNTLVRRFREIPPDLAYWWLLPEVAMCVAQGVLVFDYQGHSVQVVSGAIYGYERSTITGLQAGDSIFGVDYSGYYEERHSSTYPDITLYQIQILNVS